MKDSQLQLARASQEVADKYRQLFHISPNGLALHKIVTDDDGDPVDYIFLEINPAFEELTGLKAEDVVGERATQVIPGLEDTPFIEIYGRVAQTGEPIRFQQYAAPLNRHYEIAAFSPAPGQFAVSFVDITPLKQQEQQLRQYAKRLEQSNRDLEEFAYIASHDLQEPLRKILAFGDRLQQREAERLSAEGKDYLQRMTGASARMQTLINDLLTFSRVSTRTQPFEEVDLNETLNGALSDLQIRLRESGGEVNAAPLPTIEADPSQMRQLFLNLISNALKFHRADTLPRVQVEGRVLTNNGQEEKVAEVTVRDNGIGFSPEHAERILQPFQRLHGRSRYEGTGMGLSICRRIVERHSGTLKAEGEPDEGATFTVTFPLSQNSSGDRE